MGMLAKAERRRGSGDETVEAKARPQEPRRRDAKHRGAHRSKEMRLSCGCFGTYHALQQLWNGASH